MIVASWNCMGNFREKYKYLIKYNCDTMIIQECEDPNIVEYPKELNQLMPNFIWVGDNKNKGLAVFSKYKLSNNLWDSGGNKYFISCKVNDEFNLLGVWCHGANSGKLRYIGQMWKYMQINKENMQHNNFIIGGDFNSNKSYIVWDKRWKHSDVFNELGELGLKSLYHQFYNEEQGKETIPTFYSSKNIKAPYHIDYILASKVVYTSLSTFAVGNFHQWIQISDHMPIFIEIRI